MNLLDTLSDDNLRNLLGASIYQQAEGLYLGGRVLDRVIDDFAIVASVEDGRRSFEPEAFDEDGAVTGACDCPAGLDGFCRHIGALLIAWVRERSSFVLDDLMGLVGTASDDEEIFADTPPVQRATHEDFYKPLDPRAEYIQLLNYLMLPKLREIAQTRGVSISGNRKEPIIAALADVISSPRHLGEVWPSLSHAAQTLLGVLALIHNNGAIFLMHARQTLQMIDAKAAKQIDALLEELTLHGLIFPTGHETVQLPALLPFQLPPEPDFVTLLPEKTQLKTDAPTPAPLDLAMLTTHILLTLKVGADRFRARPAPAPHPLERQNPILQGWPHDPQELDALARERNAQYAIYSKSLSVLPAPSPLTDDARDELCRIIGADAARVDYAMRLLQELGAIRLHAGQAPEVVDDAFTKFISLPPLDRALMIFTTSVGLKVWSEIDRLPDLRRGASQPTLRHVIGAAYPINAYSVMLHHFAAARNLLLLYLRRAPSARWIDFDAFVAHARAFHTNPMFWPITNNWYLDLKGRRPNLTNAADWNATYGLFVEAVLSGPLYWQGAIELVYKGDRLNAFRITDFGARLLMQTTDYQLPASQHTSTGAALSLSSDGDLLLNIEHASTEVLSLVTQLCEARGEAKGRLLFRPNAAGAARVFEAGWTLEQLVAALEKAIGKALPKSLKKTFDTWWRNFGDIHLYSDVTLVELADDYALAELLAGTTLSQYLLYRFSPRLIALRSDGVATLQAEWVKKGYTPKTIDHEA